MSVRERADSLEALKQLPVFEGASLCYYTHTNISLFSAKARIVGSRIPDVVKAYRSCHDAQAARDLARNDFASDVVAFLDMWTSHAPSHSAESLLSRALTDLKYGALHYMYERLPADTDTEAVSEYLIDAFEGQLEIVRFCLAPKQDVRDDGLRAYHVDMILHESAIKGRLCANV